MGFFNKDNESRMSGVYAGPEFFERKYPENNEFSDVKDTVPEKNDSLSQNDSSKKEKEERRKMMDMQMMSAVYRGPEPVSPMMMVYRGPEPVSPMMMVYRGPEPLPSMIASDGPSVPAAPVSFQENMRLDAEAKGVVKCPACGQQLTGNSKFCNMCGEKLPEKTEELQYICLNCGNELHQGQMFCTECGSPTIWKEKVKYENI